MLGLETREQSLLFFRVSGFQEIFYDGRKRRQVVILTLITCYQLILGTLGILYMKNHTFVFDKRTVIALSIFTPSLDSIVFMLTAIFIFSGLTQIVLIFWCCVSFSDAPLRVQTVIQKKTESVYSCTFVTLLVCVVFSFLSATPALGCAFELFPVTTDRGRECHQRTMSSLNHYSSYPHIAERWNQLQVGYECCGAYNYSDWYRAISPNNVPDSCCKQVTNGCGRNISNPENIYQMGCLRSFVIHIRAEIGQVECLAIAGVFILWFVSVWVYGCLFNEGRFFQVTRLPILLLLMLVLMCLYAFVYPCKYMYRRIKDSQPSNSAKDGKIVTKVVLDDHNRNDTAVEVGRLDANGDIKIDIGDENANLLSIDDSKRK